MEERNRYKQRVRGQIKVQPRPVSCRLKIDDRTSKNTLAINKNEYIENTVYSSPVTSSVIHAIHKPTNIARNRIPTNKKKYKDHKLKKSLALTSNKAMVLSKSIKIHENRQEKKSHQKRKRIWKLSLGVLIFTIMGLTGYVSITTWQTNLLAKKELSQLESPTDKNSSTKNGDQVFPDGVDASKPSASSLTNYKVSPDLPRAIYVNKISVAARVMPMGLNDDNSLQSPKNAFDAGWYTDSAKPGQTGAMLIDGHSSQTGTHYGLFGYINKLTVGDQITIERGDGERFNYSVAYTEIKPIDDVDMDKLLVPYNNVSQGINLIACTGEWSNDKNSLDHRVLVYATLQS